MITDWKVGIVFRGCIIDLEHPWNFWNCQFWLNVNLTFLFVASAHEYVLLVCPSEFACPGRQWRENEPPLKSKWYQLLWWTLVWTLGLSHAHCLYDTCMCLWQKSNLAWVHGPISLCGLLHNQDIQSWYIQTFSNSICFSLLRATWWCFKINN